jgi:SulP family sulfate permease
MIGLGFTRLGQFNLLIALAIATAVAWFTNKDSVALVSSLGEIPRGLPGFEMPNIRQTLTMGITGVAVGVVGLLQAAGVAQRYPNRDGTEPDDSQDFMAQGVANVATSFFQGMPGGGSLSGTALGVSAGAQTRWASFSIAIVVMVSVLIFAGLLELIPMAALAALLIYSAALSIKFPLILSVQKTTWRSQLAMVLTFLLALVVPLQQAIVLGVVVAAVLFVYKSSTDIRVTRLQREENHWVESDPPATVQDGQTLLLDVYGSLFYAGARTLASMLPKAQGAERAVVILRIRGQGDVGSTLLNVLNKYAGQLQDGGGLLMLTGVDPAVKKRMDESRQLETIGPEHVFAATHIRHQSIEAAEQAVDEWRQAQLTFNA